MVKCLGCGKDIEHTKGVCPHCGYIEFHDKPTRIGEDRPPSCPICTMVGKTYCGAHNMRHPASALDMFFVVTVEGTAIVQIVRFDEVIDFGFTVAALLDIGYEHTKIKINLKKGN